MFERQKTGSVLCSSCGQLVGVNDEVCFHCGRRNPSMWGFGGALRALGRDMGFVKLVIGASVALYLAALALDPSGIRSGGMSLMSPSVPAMFLLGASGGMPAFEYGRWWTVLSAGWLHWGVIHIGFNMMWVRTLGPPTAELYGAGRMIIIYTVSGIVGFLFSSLAYWYTPVIPILGFLLQLLRLGGGEITAGASAPIFGLLGALLYYGRRAGSGAISREMVSYAVFLGIMGFIIPGVDNQAHLGGFVAGYLTAKFLDPLEPERGDHLLIAVICIALTALSIVVSIITGLKYFPT